MSNKAKNDYVKACELCEHSRKLNFDGELVCVYKNALKIVSSDYSCKSFSYDLFTLNPEKKKLNSVEFADI